jgi:hypothetical protein
MHVGDRVMPRDGQATGTIEQIRLSRPSSDGDYLVAEVLWDTGARCAEPLSWLGRLEDGGIRDLANGTRRGIRCASRDG